MYFQPEVYYYSNEANKNKYKDFQLTTSTKNNLKIATGCTGHCTRNDNMSYFVAWTSKYFVACACCCLKVYLQNLNIYCCLKDMFVSARYQSLYIYINTIYVKKPILSFITLVPQFILYYPQTWCITLAWAHCSQPQNKQNLYKYRKS